MNPQILNKLIDELKKDKPDHSYMRGILETLMDTIPQSVTISSQWQEVNNQPYTITTSSTPIELSDEEKEQNEIARKYLAGAASVTSI